jgi:hypothetical protein
MFRVKNTIITGHHIIYQMNINLKTKNIFYDTIFLKMSVKGEWSFVCEYGKYKNDGYR